MKKKIGLALSGGGAKGLAHVGALQFFYENDIRFDKIAGTSVGSIVGGLYSTGLTPKEILKFFTTTNMFSTQHISFNKKGFIKTHTLRKEFKKYIGNSNIENLDIDLTIVATDMLNGTIKLFKEGSLVDAILASAAYPGVFVPMKIDNILYSDGGMVNDFPIDLINNEVDISVGINLSEVNVITKKDLSNMFDIMSRSFEIIRRYNKTRKSRLCSVYLTPINGEDHIGTFDTKKEKLIETFNLGYNHTASYFQENPEKLALLKAENII